MVNETYSIDRLDLPESMLTGGFSFKHQRGYIISNSNKLPGK